MKKPKVAPHGKRRHGETIKKGRSAMRKNILFDMGNVLIRWDPPLFASRLDLSEEDRKLLLREVYDEVEWVHLDHGTMTENQAVASIRRRVPGRLHDAVEVLVKHWDEPPLSTEGTYELVRDLSNGGYGLYLLSNAGPRHPKYWPNYPVSEFFGDRLFISCQHGLMKPDHDFFEAALRHFHLDRRSCVFIDDNPANVEAAECCGMVGIVYHGDAENLRFALWKLGINV